MSNIRRIAVVGCGGINSWAIKHLHDVCKIFEKEKLIFVKLFDKDEVEEKNLLRSNQNFEVEDLMQQKAKVLGKRYNFDFNETFITEENLELLKHFDDIILGVDNHKTRQLIYKFALENDKYLLDLRAQGTLMGFTIVNGTEHKHDMEYYNSKYFKNADVMDRKGSCQLQRDITDDHIENGNKIISHFGVYGIYFKKLRGESVSTDEWKFVY